MSLLLHRIVILALCGLALLVAGPFLSPPFQSRKKKRKKKKTLTSINSTELSFFFAGQEETPFLTTNAGAPIDNARAAETVGARGPILLQDFWLIESLQVHNRERIPERVVHARGATAKGQPSLLHFFFNFFDFLEALLHDLLLASFIRSPFIFCGLNTPLVSLSQMFPTTCVNTFVQRSPAPRAVVVAMMMLPSC